MIFLRLSVGALLVMALTNTSMAGPFGAAVRETGEFILSKFGKGAAGQTVDEVTEATAKIVAKHGDEALPLLRNAGHAGFTALRNAGKNADDVIKLHARKGDDAIWIISQPGKLSIFLKHGDSAADALLKHPGISDSLIPRFGDEAVGALNSVSRQNAQRLSMLDKDGFLTATPRSKELLPVIRQYGDEAMDFIWQNKGSLAIASVLGTFLANPQAYISGAKELTVESIPWTAVFIFTIVLLVVLYFFRHRLRAWISRWFPEPFIANSLNSKIGS